MDGSAQFKDFDGYIHTHVLISPPPTHIHVQHLHPNIFYINKITFNVSFWSIKIILETKRNLIGIYRQYVLVPILME